MALAEQIERFSKAPLKYKALGLVLVSAFIGAVFYFVFYSDGQDQLTRLDREVKGLQEEVASYEEKKKKYMAFRAEVNKLLEEQKELIKVLPTEAEIPTFLQSLHAQIPVRMAITGTFHQITKFFHSVGQLKRIVNINDLNLGTPAVTEHGVMLRANFVASTFRFIAPQGGPPGAGG
jgi:type IV pilus assembly protein PilO